MENGCIFTSETNRETMKNYKAVITETTSPSNGQVVANTKSPSQFKGMSKEQFTASTKYISAYKISIIEM